MPYGEKVKLLWANPAYRKRMSEAHKGQKAWNRIENWKNCLFCTDEFRSAPALKQKFCSKMCYSKSQLKENPGYQAIHAWIRKVLGKAMKCEHCKTKSAKRYEWANKSHEYKRITNDWMQLCCSCHQKYDKNV